MTAPLTPHDCDLRDFQFMPLDIVRLFSSEFHAVASDSEWRAGVTLWLKSFHQVPAASLPDDDVQLCRLAELGRDLKAWRKLRGGALHGWVACDDGRLYHPVVAEKANEAWDRKKFQRERSRRASEARWNRSGGQDEPQSSPRSIANAQASGVHDGAGKEDRTHSFTDASSILERHQGTGTGTGTGITPEERSSGGLPKGSRLPPDWVPSELDRAYGISRGFTPPAVERMAEKFRNYWTAKTGKDATKRDWPATWRNWVLTEAEKRPTGAARAEVDWIG